MEINTNSKQEVRQWKIITLVLFSFIFILAIVGLCFFVDDKSYERGYDIGFSEGSLYMLNDICVDGAITTYNNMTRIDYPLQDACDILRRGLK